MNLELYIMGCNQKNVFISPGKMTYNKSTLKNSEGFAKATSKDTSTRDEEENILIASL